MLFAGLTFAQVKVHTGGETGVGPGFTNGSETPDEQLSVDGNAEVLGNRFYVGQNAGNTGVYLEIGKDRAIAGYSGLKFYNDNSANPGFDFNISTAGNGNFYQHGTTALQFVLDAAETAASINFKSTGATTMRIINNQVGIGTNGPTEKLTVNGNIKLIGGGMVVTSDEKTKKNVNKFTLGLDEVMQLKPISYQYNGKAGVEDTERSHVGILAQNLQDVAPMMVESFVHEEIVNDEYKSGEYKSVSKEEFLQIRDNEIKYLLINAIQDQQVIIEAKEERISNLESRLSQLEGMIEDIAASQTNGSANQNIILEGTNATLLQNRPNPFNENTVIEYVLPENATDAVVQILDMNGRLLKQIVLSKDARNGTLNLEAQGLMSGTYMYNLMIDGELIDTKKMVLTK